MVSKNFNRILVAVFFLFAVVFTALIPRQASGQGGMDYLVGPQDVLTVTLRDRLDLSGKYVVQSDGSFNFPLVGAIKASGLATAAVEAELRRRLADGFFKNPQLSVTVEQFRSQRFFVMGEVGKPGNYPLSGEITLLEGLAAAGPVSPNAGDQVVIVRPPANRVPAGPILPDQIPDAEIIRVDLSKLQSGSMAQGMSLRNGDTIFVPRAETIFVFGQVRNPGSYPVRKSTTVLQALALAGGLTDRGSTNRIRVVRVVGGKQKDTKVNLTDVLQPNDTLIVPERWF
jgi:polysaccharide export outer membrane protein